MDDNLIGRWVFPTIGALTALYVYNTVFDNKETKSHLNSVNNVETGISNNDLKQVNEEMLSDASNVKYVDIVKKDAATDMSSSFLKESVIAIEQEDYEDVADSTVNDMSKTTSKAKRWWY